MSGRTAFLSSTLLNLILLSLLLLGGAIRAETSGQQLAEAAGRGLVGSPAPKLMLKTIDGETIDLGALYGKKAVYVKFWATWCAPCREQMPHFEHTFESSGSDLAVIAIDVGLADSLEAIRAYRRKLGITMPIAFDEDGHLGAAFNLRVTPQHIVIGRDGHIQYVGHLADQRLDAALVAARGPDRKVGQGVLSERAPADSPYFTVGDPLPEQSVHLVDGQSFKFKEPGEHQPTVLVFLSPWCESYLATTRPAVAASCRRTREWVTTLAHDGRARWLGIASGLWSKADDLRGYRKQYKVTIPLTLDASGSLFREFRVNDVPTVIVADAHGKIVQRVDRPMTKACRTCLMGCD